MLAGNGSAFSLTSWDSLPLSNILDTEHGKDSSVGANDEKNCVRASAPHPDREKPRR